MTFLTFPPHILTYEPLKIIETDQLLVFGSHIHISSVVHCIIFYIDLNKLFTHVLLALHIVTTSERFDLLRSDYKVLIRHVRG